MAAIFNSTEEVTFNPACVCQFIYCHVKTTENYMKILPETYLWTTMN